MYFPDDDGEAPPPAQNGGVKRARPAASDDDDALDAATMVVEATHFKQPRLMPDAALCELLDLPQEILTVIAGFLSTNNASLRNLAATQHLLADIVSRALADAYVKATKEVRELQQSDAFDFWTNDAPVMVRMRECSAVRRAAVNSGVANQTVWAYAAAERGITTEHLFAQATATQNLAWPLLNIDKRGQLIYDFIVAQRINRDELRQLRETGVSDADTRYDDIDSLRRSQWPSFALCDEDIHASEFDLLDQIGGAWFPGFKAMVEEALPGAHEWPYELFYMVLGRFPVVANHILGSAPFESDEKKKEASWVAGFLSEWVQDSTEDFISAVALNASGCAPNVFLYAILRMVALHGWPDDSISFDIKLRELQAAFVYERNDLLVFREKDDEAIQMNFLSTALFHFYFGNADRRRTGAFFFAPDDKTPRFRFASVREMWSAISGYARTARQHSFGGVAGEEPRTLLAFFEHICAIKPAECDSNTFHRIKHDVIPLLRHIEEARQAAAAAAAGD